MSKHTIFAAAVILVIGMAAGQAMRADGVPGTRAYIRPLACGARATLPLRQGRAYRCGRLGLPRLQINPSRASVESAP